MPLAFLILQEKLEQIQSEKGVSTNVNIGGALMLPYFDYEVPDDIGEGEIFAKPNQFLDQTKAALEYYSKLFESDKIFNQVYVAGWDPITRVSKFEVGGILNLIHLYLLKHMQPWVH